MARPAAPWQMHGSACRSVAGWTGHGIVRTMAGRQPAMLIRLAGKLPVRQCSSAWPEHSPCKRRVEGSKPSIGLITNQTGAAAGRAYGCGKRYSLSPLPFPARSADTGYPARVDRPQDGRRGGRAWRGRLPRPGAGRAPRPEGTHPAARGNACAARRDTRHPKGRLDGRNAAEKVQEAQADPRRTRPHETVRHGEPWQPMDGRWLRVRGRHGARIAWPGALGSAAQKGLPRWPAGRRTAWPGALGSAAQASALPVPDGEIKARGKPASIMSGRGTQSCADGQNRAAA